MAEAIVTVKVSATIQTFKTSPNSSNRPDNILAEFSAQYRQENHVVQVAASSSYTVTMANLGLSTTDLVKVEVLTAGKSATLRFDGDPNGMPIVPVTTEETAFMIASANLDTIEIVNPDASPIDVAISAFRKQQ